jgi:hypothetical protein
VPPIVLSLVAAISWPSAGYWQVGLEWSRFHVCPCVEQYARGRVSGVVMADTRVLVEQLELHCDDEAMEACDSAWASLSSLTASAAWVVARRVAVLLVVVVAALAPWQPTDPVVSWLCISRSAALKCDLDLAQFLVLGSGLNWRHSRHAMS